MPRQRTAQRPTDVQAPVNPRPQACLHFSPERAVQAIVFHLIDERAATRVSDESARSIVVRLRRAGVSLSVEQSTWADMTNVQRLDWLLDRTHTTARVVHPDLSVLETVR